MNSIILEQKVDIRFPSVGFIVVVILIWHLPLFFIPSFWKSLPLVVQKPIQEVYLVYQPSTKVENEAKSLNGWNDPTVFLLPTLKGFSASLYHPPIFSSEFDKREVELPLFFLEDQTQSVESDFQLNDLGLIFNMVNLEGNSRSNIKKLENEMGLLQAGSAWRIYGLLEKRSILTNIILPSIYTSELLRPTHLRLGVDLLGNVVYSTLEKSSGMGQADELAIEFSKKIKFSSIEKLSEKETIQWGFLKILWCAEDLSKKNDF